MQDAESTRAPRAASHDCAGPIRPAGALFAKKDCLVFQGTTAPSRTGPLTAQDGSRATRPETDRMLPIEPLRALRRCFDGADAAGDERSLDTEKTKSSAACICGGGLFACGIQNLRRGSTRSTSITRRTARRDATQVTCLRYCGGALIHVPRPAAWFAKGTAQLKPVRDAAVDTLYTKFLKEIDARYGAATRVCVPRSMGISGARAGGGLELKILRCAIGRPLRPGAQLAVVSRDRDGEQPQRSSSVTRPASIAASLTASGDLVGSE